MVELIISGVALVISFTAMMITRHYYLETKTIEQRFHDRRKEQSGPRTGNYPKYGTKDAEGRG